MNKKQAYIVATIKPDILKNLVEWSKSAIPKEVLFQSKINGKIEGGNMLSDAHLTLFFGLNDNLIDRKEIQKFIHSLPPVTLNIVEIKAFQIIHMNAKIIYFSVSDKEGTLKKIHNEFSKWPHYQEDQQPFIPHITIAYVIDSFNEKTLKYDGPDIIPISSIEYLEYDRFSKNLL